MTEQPIGVKAIWDGTQFGPGWQDYMKKLALANQATASNTKQIAESWMRFENAFKRVGQGIKDDTKLIAESLMRMERDSKVAIDNLAKNIAIGNRLLAEVVSNTAQGLSSSAKTMATATKQIEVSGRKWIATISGIFAVLRMAPQIAAQFGEAMREAAGGAAMKEAFDNLAEFSRVSTDALIQNMKDASRNTINEVELIRAANRALMIGGMEFADDVPRLLEISRAAAIATGKDVNWVFQTLTQGIARSSAKLIDNAEIYLRLGRVVDDYAESVGKTADELDSSTRQMIVRNAVMEQGGELVRAVGSDVDVATDRWDRYTASITNAKQATLEFLNKTMGPLAPALAAVFTELNNIAPVLQTIALLKLAGVGQLIAQLGGVTGILGAAFSALAPPIIAVAAALLTYELGIRRLFPLLPSVGDATKYVASNLDLLSTSMQWGVRSLLSGKEAADEWFKAVTGITRAQTEAQLQLSQYVKELGSGEDAYKAYIIKLNEINALLPAGARLMEALTRAQFNFRQELREGRGDLEAQVDLLREYGFEASKIAGGMGAGGINAIFDALSFIGQKSDEEKRAERQREAAKRMLDMYKETAADLSKEWDKMWADKIKLEAKIAEDSEDIVKKHNAKMVDLAADAARDRADAFRDYQRGIRDAELKRNRSIEDASRKHRQNLIDIEYDYRRRVLEIEEEYQRTVYEAALGRDALAIIRARRRKQEELTGAGRDRQDAIRDEGINFRESLYQAERAYQDRLAAIRLALSDELQEIERKLAEGTQKQKEAYEERLTNLENSLKDELEALNAGLKKQMDAVDRAVAYMNARRRSLSGALPVYNLPGGTTEMQEGFSGVVTGPHTFKVEPGVTEYVYASGNMAGGRQRVMPSAATNQSQGLRAMVGGAVNVGLSGFSNSLMQRVTESLTTTVGQAVMDEMATQILGA